MSARDTFRYFAILSLSVAAVFLLAPDAFAQGCAMCYKNAAASGPQGAAALRRGILILLVPTLGQFSFIFAFLYRRRNASRARGDVAPEDRV